MHRQFKVLEEKNDRKKRSIRNFFFFFFFFFPPLKIDGQLKMFRSQFSLQITGGGQGWVGRERGRRKRNAGGTMENERACRVFPRIKGTIDVGR